MTLDLKKLKELCEKATPGPWEIRYRDIDDNHEQAKVWAENFGWLITRGDLPRSYHDPSMEFIAAARTALPQLIERVEELEAEVKIARERLGPAGWKMLQRIPELESQLATAIEALEKIEDLLPLQERERRTIARAALSAIRGETPEQKAQKAYEYQQEMQKANQKLKELSVGAKIRGGGK